MKETCFGYLVLETTDNIFSNYDNKVDICHENDFCAQQELFLDIYVACAKYDFVTNEAWYDVDLVSIYKVDFETF